MQNRINPCQKPFFYKNSSTHKKLLGLFIFSVLFFLISFFIPTKGIIEKLSSVSIGYVTGFFFYYMTIYNEKKSLNKETLHYIVLTINCLETKRYKEIKENEKLKEYSRNIINLSSANPIYVRMFFTQFSAFIQDGIENDEFCTHWIKEFDNFLNNFTDSKELAIEIEDMEEHIKERMHTHTHSN